MNKSKAIFVGNREIGEIADSKAFMRDLKTSCDAVALFKEYSDALAPHLETAFGGLARLLESAVQLKSMTITYFWERILNGARSCLLLTDDNPTYSYTDTASINRANLELAINCVALLKDKDNSLFASLIQDGHRADKVAHNELKIWTEHPNKEISIPAKFQFDNTSVSTDEKIRHILHLLNVTSPGPLPTLSARAKYAGDSWYYLYVCRYRQLCGWSHFHPGEVFLSPMNRLKSGDECTGLRRGIEMLHFSYHLIFLLMEDINSISGASSVELRQFYEKWMGRFKSITDQSSFLGPIHIEETN